MTFDPYRGTNNYNGVGSVRSLEQSFIQSTLTSLSLTSQFALDAADGKSARPGEQLWYDTSPNGQHFSLGADLTASVSDPTFTGVANSLSKDTYFAFDGGDVFNYPSGNPAWIPTVSMAGGIISGGMWLYGPSGVGYTFIATRTPAATANGWMLYRTSLNKFSFFVGNGTGTALSCITTASIPANTWTFLGITHNEAFGALGTTLQIDGTQQQFTSTYTSPSATPTTSMRIGAFGNGSSPIASGHQMNMVVFDNTYWGATKLNDFYNATKGRFA